MFHNLIVTAKVPVAWIEDQYGPDWRDFPGVPDPGVEVDGIVSFDFVLTGGVDFESGTLAWNALVHAWESGAVTHSIDS